MPLLPLHKRKTNSVVYSTITGFPSLIKSPQGKILHDYGIRGVNPTLLNSLRINEPDTQVDHFQDLPNRD